MTQYWYKALNGKGQVVKDYQQASSKQNLSKILQMQQKELISARPSFQISLPFKKASNQMLLEFYVQLKCLLEANLTITDAVKSISEEQSSSSFKNSLTKIILNLESGNSFSMSVKNDPSFSDPILINLLEVGEEMGTLPEAFSHIIQHLKWQDQIKQHSKKALTYPFLLTGVLGVSFYVLFKTLIPQLNDFLTSIEGEIPFATKILLYLSDFIGYWGLFLVIGIVSSLGVLYLMGCLSQSLRLLLAKFIFVIPVVGSFVLSLNLMRFFHTVSLLQTSHVDLVKSLQLGKQSIQNSYLKSQLEWVINNTITGQKLSHSLSYLNLIPRSVTQMVRVGEQSGQLSPLFQHIKSYYERDVDIKSTALLKILEPMILLILGGIILFVVMGVFYPLYDSLLVLDI